MATYFQETRALPSSAERWERIEFAPRDAGLRPDRLTRVTEGATLGALSGGLLSVYWVSGYQTPLVLTVFVLVVLSAVVGAVLQFAAIQRR